MTSQEKGERAALCGRISDVSERASEHGMEEEGGGEVGMDGKGMMARVCGCMLLFFLSNVLCQL